MLSAIVGFNLLNNDLVTLFIPLLGVQPLIRDVLSCEMCLFVWKTFVSTLPSCSDTKYWTPKESRQPWPQNRQPRLSLNPLRPWTQNSTGWDIPRYVFPLWSLLAEDSSKIIFFWFLDTNISFLNVSHVIAVLVFT